MFIVKKPKKKRDIALLVSIVVVLAIVIYIFASRGATISSDPSSFTLFVCSDSKTIQALFYPQKDLYVDLVLSDGRKMTVPHAISASGARYANSDESFVFWNKGNTAFVEEKGVMTYKNCLTE